jgi:hypothetical protein
MINSGAKMTTEMTSEKDKEPENAQAAETENAAAGSEMSEPCWSVVSFESVAARGLTYTEAHKRLEKLEKQNISGLCIITDEAAARLATGKE